MAHQRTRLYHPFFQEGEREFPGIPPVTDRPPHEELFIGDHLKIQFKGPVK